MFDCDLGMRLTEEKTLQMNIFLRLFWKPHKRCLFFVFTNLWIFPKHVDILFQRPISQVSILDRKKCRAKIEQKSHEPKKKTRDFSMHRKS